MRLFLFIGGALLLGGCSSVPMQKAENTGNAVCDYDKMARIERASAGMNAQIFWVNCPLTYRDRAKTS